MRRYILTLIITLTPVFLIYPQISNWILLNSGTFENFNDISCPSANEVFAGGNNGNIYFSYDLGSNWIQIPFPVSSNILSVYFVGTTGYAGCSNNKIYKTTNSGGSWTQYSSASSYAVTSLSFINANTGFLGDSYGNIQKTTNGGLNWSIIRIMPGYSSKVFLLDVNRGWAVDTYGYISITTNGGINFSNVRISTDTLSGIHFLSSTLGYTAGDNGRIYKTTNGGYNWLLMNTNSTDKLKSVFCLDNNNTYAVGNSGTILQTTTNGLTWSKITKTLNNLNSIKFFNQNFGYIAGDNGTILGREPVPGNVIIGSDTIRTGFPFYTYYMDSRTQILYLSNELIAGGGSPSGGIINRISFNVASYAPQMMNGLEIKLQNTLANNITSFENNYWTTVYQGNDFIEQNGWKTFNLTTPFFWDGSNLLIDICFNNSFYTTNSLVRATNANYKVIHQHADLTSGNGCTDLTTPQSFNTRPNIVLDIPVLTGNENQGSNLPADYRLYQNYPNPFNPSTKIKFDLPEPGFTTLKIFNILGQNVATLINENKNEGTYVLDFNASNLPSGIYFYKLISGDFIQIKKMIYIK